MADYTFEELADMQLAYGMAGRNSRRAREIYQNEHPGRRIPDHKTFVAIDRRLRETGSFVVHRPDAGRDRSTRTPRVEEAVVRMFAENQATSTRAVGQALQISHVSAWEIMHEDLQHPFHRQRVQAMGPADYPERLRFAQWFLQRHEDEPAFPSNLLCTDEAMFSRDGLFNTHNSHVWDYENPHEIIEHGFQQRFSLNVWCGIVQDRLIGSHILPARLNGAEYHRFLTEVLPNLLEDVPLHERDGMWFQHDGAPAHFSGEVRAYLNVAFPQRWIGRLGPRAWPARSPDLNPIDFFLWGHLKTIVYETPVEDEVELQARVEDACERVRQTPEIFARVRDSFLRRCTLCVQVNGGHVEHLL